MPESADRWKELMDEIRALLREIHDGKGPGGQLFEISERLVALDELYRAATGGEAPGAKSRRPARLAGRKYQIDRVKGGEYLAEYRASGQQPFRCPQETYKSFAEILEKTAAPLSFEDLLVQLRKLKCNARVADYLPRMCLRFWTTTSPPLVQRNRKRYAPVKRSGFKRQALQAWSELETVKL
jgi:hypothetical protein